MFSLDWEPLVFGAAQEVNKKQQLLILDIFHRILLMNYVYFFQSFELLWSSNGFFP